MTDVALNTDQELWETLGYATFMSRKRAIDAGDEWHLPGYPPTHALAKRTAVQANPKLKPPRKAPSITNADWDLLDHDDKMNRSRAEAAGQPWAPRPGAYDAALAGRVSLVVKKR